MSHPKCTKIRASFNKDLSNSCCVSGALFTRFYKPLSLRSLKSSWRREPNNPIKNIKHTTVQPRRKWHSVSEKGRGSGCRQSQGLLEDVKPKWWSENSNCRWRSGERPSPEEKPAWARTACAHDISSRVHESFFLFLSLGTNLRCLLIWGHFTG